MRVAICLEDARHGGLDELRRRADSQYACGVASQHSASRRECLCFRDQMAAARDKLATLHREVELATDTVEKPDAELSFQITDLARQRGLADV